VCPLKLPFVVAQCESQVGQSEDGTGHTGMCKQTAKSGSCKRKRNLCLPAPIRTMTVGSGISPDRPRRLGDGVRGL